jgi:mono/diheme cytochrome c family protein
MSATTLRLVAALALLGVSACSTRSHEPRVATLSLTEEQRHGQVLFNKFCHQCHPNGEAGLGPSINSNPAPMAAFRAQVRAGLGAMPSFPEELIADRDLDQLLAFVGTQREQHD